MTPLARQLLREIRADGPMRFDRYMERALFDPAHGYYASGRAAIGREGDFYTSVSVGPAFGRLLAAQCAEVWEKLDRPGTFDIVEQGANDGRLAADILTALSTDHEACFSGAVYTLVEPFPHLREKQAHMLEPFQDRVRWTSTLENNFCGVHLTNEYADALPVRIFVRRGNAWHERHVAANGETLEFADIACEAPPSDLPHEAPDGYLAEIRPVAREWIQSVATRLERGLMLVIDYGFPRDTLHAPWRTDGTLSCYRAHRRGNDPIDSPGEWDLTAHVDFTALAETGRDCGLAIEGFADQHHFVVGAGTPLLLALESAPQSPDRDATLRALKTLLHPETMGTQFKYLAMMRDLAPGLAGFRLGKPAAANLGLS